MSDKKPKATATERLVSILGFDPAKGASPSGDVFQEALKEIGDERMAKVKVRAKEQLVKAIELREQMAAARKKFNREDSKFEKDLGKVLNGIEQMVNGGGSPPDDGDGDDAPDEEQAEEA